MGSALRRGEGAQVEDKLPEILIAEGTPSRHAVTLTAIVEDPVDFAVRLALDAGSIEGGATLSASARGTVAAAAVKLVALGAVGDIEGRRGQGIDHGACGSGDLRAPGAGDIRPAAAGQQKQWR